MARSRSPSRERSRPSRYSQRDRDRDRDRERERERDRGSHSYSHSHSRRRSRSRSRSRSRGRRRDDERTTGERKDERVDAKSASASGSAAKTEDKNGEISMSVEETNKLRAQLGLKPLAVGPASASAEVNLQKTSAQLDAERAQRQLEQALAQSRKRRELSQKLAGQSIGEQLRAEADARDALSWVKKSRAATASHTATKSNSSAAAATAESTYDASSLAGMTVGHAADAFEEGQEVVLTLKDAGVLAADGRNVNDADDELVNVELSERDRRGEQRARAERAAMPAYSGYDDDEFVQMGQARRKPKARGTKLLAQYDEEEDARAAHEARKFTLDASGAAAVAVEARGGQGHGGEGEAFEDEDGVAVISLAMDRTKAAADYYTAEEMETQFKKKGKKLRKKKKKKTREREGEEEEAGDGDKSAEGDDTTSLIAQLEAEARKNAGQDRGKRKRRHAPDDEGEEEDTELVAEDRAGLERFQHARDKANVAASEALAASNLAVQGGDVVQAPKRKRRAAGGVDYDAAMADDALDIELSASLARARRLAQLQEAAREEEEETKSAAAPAALVGPASEDRIALLVRSTVGAAASPRAEAESASMEVEGAAASALSAGHVFGQAPGASAASAHTVVFNDATDFETRLRSAMEKRAAQFQAAATPGAAPAAADRGSTAMSGQEAPEVADGADADEERKEDGEEDAEDEPSDVFGEEQPLVSSGLGATLALLKKTGDLREARVERQAGRANDARDRNVDEALRIKDGVKLDYRDEFGRVLTKKEAFRMLSYKFHGHGPGKKKQEKRLRQLKQELEAQKLLSAEGSTKMMEVLEKKQKAGKQAHVVLSSGA